MVLHKNCGKQLKVSNLFLFTLENSGYLFKFLLESGVITLHANVKKHCSFWSLAPWI